MEHIGTFLVLVFWENLEMKEKRFEYNFILSGIGKRRKYIFNRWNNLVNP